MQGAGVGHDNCIRFSVQGAAQIGFHREANQFIIRQTGAVCPIQDNIVLAKHPQVAEVAAADGTKSGNQELHLSFLLSIKLE